MCLVCVPLFPESHKNSRMKGSSSGTCSKKLSCATWSVIARSFQTVEEETKGLGEIIQEWTSFSSPKIHPSAKRSMPLENVTFTKQLGNEQCVAEDISLSVKLSSSCFVWVMITITYQNCISNSQLTGTPHCRWCGFLGNQRYRRKSVDLSW